MASTTLNQPVFGASQAEFFSGPVSINVASRNSHNEASIARAYGCTVSADYSEITVFVSIPESTLLLKNLRAGGSIAVVFSRPLTHQTIQLKGLSARVSSTTEVDRQLITDYAAKLAAEIRALGYDNQFAQGLVRPSTDNAAAIVFRPVAAFEQTPGLGAGAPLEAPP